MGTLGFEVETQSNTTLSRSGRRSRDESEVAVAGRGGKVRRRLSDATAAVQLGVPYAQASRPQQEQPGHGYAVYDDSRMVETTRAYARPHSAKLLRASRNRGRPTSASSARCSNNMNRTCYSGIKDMDILLEICKDQGRAGSLDPADFDSR